MYYKGDALNMVWVGVTVTLFILGVSEGVQARHKRWKNTVASTDVDDFFLTQREGKDAWTVEE